jgi:hypothetical protein
LRAPPRRTTIRLDELAFHSAARFDSLRPLSFSLGYLSLDSSWSFF